MRPISNDGSWSLQSVRASLRCGLLAAQVDVDRPQLGLHELRVGSVSLSGSIAGVRRGDDCDPTATWPVQVTDKYIRGNDLVAAYRAADDWPFAPQIYWRAGGVGPAEQLASFSLLLSVSTHLLDTHPQICVATQLDADELLLVDPTAVRPTAIPVATDRHVVCPDGRDCCVVWRLTGGELSYAEIVPASDFHELTLLSNAPLRPTAHWQLFSEFLEKGVIRRARVHTVFLPRARDLELASAYCQQLASRPLPLTT